MIELDSAQILWYLEGCAHGSHLRQGCWHDMIRLYPKMSQSMIDFLFTYAMRDISPIFEKDDITGHRPCGADDFDQFLACFNKNNRYYVTPQLVGFNGKGMNTYLYRGEYYIDHNRYIDKDFIVSVEKIGDENF